MAGLSFANRIRLPLIAAPMFLVSGPELVIAACRNGVVGSFPTANCRSAEELDDWLCRIESAPASGDYPRAPYCPNLIIHQPRLAEDLACLLRHRPELVITSVGSPAPVVAPLHDVGCQVFADVATMRHAERALEAGCDGLVLLSAGAGGQTGWLNPFAFVRAVRALFDGPIVLAGGMSDGTALHAARVLGCDLAYMGTKFIATAESMAPEAYKAMLVDSRCDDVFLTRAVTGLEANILRPSLERVGINPDDLRAMERSHHSADELRQVFDQQNTEKGAATRWKDVWSAGHTVSGVSAVPSVAKLIADVEAEYRAAQEAHV